MRLAKKFDDLFLKVSTIVEKVAEETGFAALDLVSRNVLVHICTAAAAGSAPRVTEVMDERKLGSRQTIHGRIHDLLQQGWILAVTDQGDGRAKLLQPSAQTVKVIGRISQSLRGNLR